MPKSLSLTSVLLLALIWGPSVALAAIEGVVLTPDDVPIEGADVEVVDGTERDRTGRRGTFSVPDTDPPVLLLVTHPRFEDGAVEVAATQDGLLEVTLQPRQEVFEQIVVSANRDAGGTFQAVSVAATAVDPADEPAPPSTVMDVIEGVPGVAENGQGGLFQTFSVRGTAGQRVQTLVAGAQIVTERRAGVSASWIDPTLLGTIDVLRGPSSSYYGSGALGGVVQIFPRRFDQLAFAAGYSGAGDETFQMAGWGDGTWSAGVAHRKAGDAETPDGLRLYSRYEQWSATVARRWMTEGGLEVDLTAIPTLAEDIGKPNNQFPGTVTTYPEETHLVMKASVRRPGEWRLDVFGHPNTLETEDVEDGERALVENEALDFGLNAQREFDLPWQLAGRVGVDVFSRQGVQATETQRAVLPGGGFGPVLERATTLDGSEDQAAVYGAVRRPVGRATVEAGGRFSFIQQDNAGFDTQDDTAWSGFVGATVPLVGGFELAGNVGTGLRFPTLSERFFTGTTGRGEVISNVDLDPERSVSGDVGLRYFGQSLYSAVYLFTNEIDDYIERIDVEPGVRTFVNLTSGTIEGLELDGFYQLLPTLRLSWGGQWLDGETDDGDPLGDIPADRVHLGGQWQSGRWSARSRLQHRFSKDDPGPGEVALDSTDLLSASVAYAIRDGFELIASGDNLLDETYLPSADDRSVPAPERSFGISVRWTD